MWQSNLDARLRSNSGRSLFASNSVVCSSPQHQHHLGRNPASTLTIASSLAWLSSCHRSSFLLLSKSFSRVRTCDPVPSISVSRTGSCYLQHPQVTLSACSTTGLKPRSDVYPPQVRWPSLKHRPSSAESVKPASINQSVPQQRTMSNLAATDNGAEEPIR